MASATNGHSKRFSSPYLMMLGFVVILIIAGIDILSGYEISFSFFYLIPVCYFTWFFGRRWGIWIAVLCAFLWFWCDQYTGHPYSSAWIQYWNSLIRLGFFLIVGVLLDLVRIDHKKANDALDEVATLSEIKSEFTWMVSNRLRTGLLNVSEEILEAQRSSAEAPGNKSESLQLAAKNATIMLRLIDDVTSFTALQSRRLDLKPVPVDLKPIISSAVAFQKTIAAKKNLKIETEMPASLPRVLAESESVSQALHALISNAVRFSDHGKITVRVVRSGAEAQITVQDEGQGISAQDRDRVFKPFEHTVSQSEAESEGTGLGLAIAKLIVNRHGGRIWIESELNKGTSIHFTLPFAAG